jgi:hypothetical protein
VPAKFEEPKSVTWQTVFLSILACLTPVRSMKRLREAQGVDESQCGQTGPTLRGVPTPTASSVITLCMSQIA